MVTEENQSRGSDYLIKGRLGASSAPQLRLSVQHNDMNYYYRLKLPSRNCSPL